MSLKAAEGPTPRDHQGVDYALQLEYQAWVDELLDVGAGLLHSERAALYQSEIL